MGEWEFAQENQVFIELDGKRLAGVQEYRLQAVKDMRYVRAFGEELPVAILPGEIHYKIELKQITPFCQEESLYTLENFYFVMTGKEKKTIYSGCRWERIEEYSESGSPIVVKKAVITAQDREEEVEGL